MAPLSPPQSPMNSTPRARPASRRLSSFHTVRKQPRLSMFNTPRRRETIATPTPKAALPTHTPGRRKSVSRVARPADAAAHSSVPIARMSDSELAEMYSTTIKLCQDNKINVKNTWSLNLIDYMGMLVKDGPGADGEEAVVSQAPTGDTNFQIAGVTLDAGVRIYCSRVDSVHTNAFKVLGALSRTSKPNTSGEIDGDGESIDDESDDGVRKKRKRGAHRSGGNTLEANLETITTRKLETDLAVDPLFQKMSAAFDEGGAKGMLLNNLSVGPRCEIIFDSSEPAMTRSSHEVSESSSPLHGNAASGMEQDEQEEPSAYDVSRLLPPPPKSDGPPMTLCPRFMAFYHSRMARSEAADTSRAPTDLSQTSTANSSASTAAFGDKGETDFGFEYNENDIHAGDGLGSMPSYLPAGASQDDSADCNTDFLEDDDDAGVLGAPNGWDSSRLSHSGAALMSGAVDLIEAGMVLHRDSEYSFFDASALSSWAGPQHWRFRTTVASSGSAEGGSEVSSGNTRKRAKGKTAMLLDFSSEAPDLDFAAEFARPKNPATCQLSVGVLEGFSEKKVTLPEDQHFKTQTLATLFLKPDMAVVAKRKRQQPGGQVEGGPGEEDGSAQGWYDFENDGDNDNFCSGNDDDANQLFAFDDEAVESPSRSKNGLGGDMGGDMDLVAEPTRMEKIDIGFATVAKKVDVRQLKSGMWTQLRAGAQEEEQTDANGTEAGDDASADKATAEPDCGSSPETEDVRKGGVQTLQQLVGNMPAYVPGPSLPDVSLSYVFICLLHLANEKTLSISSPESGSLDDLVIRSSRTPDNSQAQ